MTDTDREREGGGDRQRQRDRDRYSYRYRQREGDRQTDRDKETDRHRQRVGGAEQEYSHGRLAVKSQALCPPPGSPAESSSVQTLHKSLGSDHKPRSHASKMITLKTRQSVSKFSG